MENDQNYLVHPSYLILFLIIAGIIALFLGFSGAFLFNRLDQSIPPVQLPSLFYWNTIFLLASSGTLLWAKKAYSKDQSFQYKLSLFLTLILTFTFLISQFFGWQQLQSNNIFLGDNNMASYLYVISGLHFVHVIGGIPFLLYFLIIAVVKLKTPVDGLIYFTDKSKHRKLELLSLYWHFLDALWIYLVLFFMLNYVLK